MHDLDRTQPETYDEVYESGEFGFEPELPGGTFDRPFSEAELNELAMELLSVQDEQELDRFLGSLFKKATRALGKIARGPAGIALKGILKDAMTKAVPLLGGLAGPFTPALAAGAVTGAAIKDSLELEGVPDENRNIEAAKKVIEVGGVAAQQVAAMPPNAPPQAAVDALQTAAVQQGLPAGGGAALPGPAGSAGDPSSATGRWYRSGRTIVVVGL